jgi:hypothetical protein
MGGDPESSFFRRTGLLLPAVLAPVVETALVRTFSPASAALAPQVTAPPPFDLFHDLRWISVFHNSWWTLAVELLGVLFLRSLWMAWVVQRAWPRSELPPMRGAALRVSLYYVGATVLFIPWVVILFGLAFSHLSFLFFGAIPPAVALAAVIGRGAASQAAGYLWAWRPSWRSLAWVLASFVWLTMSGAVTSTAPTPVALLAAGGAGLLNARALFGVVQDIALGPRRRALPVVAPALIVGVFVAAFGGAAIGFAVTMGGHEPATGRGPALAADPGEHPVLVAAGLHSHYDPRSPLDLPRGYVGWRFSYTGIDAKGRPLPYEPEDTQQSLLLSARHMAQQVHRLHHAYREPVTLVAESEGALIARTYLTSLYRPASHAVDRLITLDMISGVSGVYFPPPGKQGWGVGSGWGLRGLTNVLEAIAPLRLSVDSGLGRDFTNCRALLTRLAGSPPPPGVQEVSFQALADWVDPASAAPGVDTILVNAPHGGLVSRTGVQLLIHSILDGDAVLPTSGDAGILARFVHATARPWEVPNLPLSLDPAATCPAGT